MDLKEQLIEYLEQCDLTQNDATVYFCLLKHGQLGPSDISNITGIKRARVYDSLKRLIDRCFVVQEIKEKRPKYITTSPETLLMELEEEISFKKKAYEEIKKYFIEQPITPRVSGIYFYNSNNSLRLKLRQIMEASRKKILIMAVLPDSINDEDIIPFKLLAEKHDRGQKIAVLINVNAKNWEICSDLNSKNIKLYHFPYSKQLSTLFHIIDDESLLISVYDQESNKIRLRQGILFEGQKNFATVFNLIIDVFIEKSQPFGKRIEELRKAVIYPTTKFKKIFGVDN